MSNVSVALRQTAIDRLKVSQDKPTPEEYVGRIIFLCNRKACPNCIYPECKHTSNIEYAKSFEKHFARTGDFFWEMEHPEETETPEGIE